MDSLAIFPSYVGSKKYYVPRLPELAGRNIVEFFAGSAALTMSYAQRAVLIDNDPFVAKIIQHFDQQIVNIPYMSEDIYYSLRGEEDWWKYSFLLQKFSFSGVFRYSENGFNVPMKSCYKGGERFPLESVRDDYRKILERWKTLHLGTSTYCMDYRNVDEALFSSLDNPVLVFDPPYQTSQAAYNNGTFDYSAYWDIVKAYAANYDVLVFDTVENLGKQNLTPSITRKMRVNGSKEGSFEGVWRNWGVGLW